MIKQIWRILFSNFPRRLFSIFVAIAIWLAINESITTTKVIPNVPVYLEKIPQGKTVTGINPSGKLPKTLTLTVTGNRNVLERLTPHNLEVVISSNNKGMQWSEKIGKHHLRAADQEIDINRYVSKVKTDPFFVHLTKIVADFIPVYIRNPIGEAPDGYQFINVWPQRLIQKVSGPENEISQLKNEGLTVTFDLSRVRKRDLDTLFAANPENNEVRFLVPKDWKRVYVPFLADPQIEIEDPLANELSLEFLKTEFLELDTQIPLRLFFSAKDAHLINPTNCTLVEGAHVKNHYGSWLLDLPLSTKDVSREFLNVVKDRMEIAIHATPTNDGSLPWGIEFVDPESLESQYVKLLLPINKGSSELSQASLKTLETSLRQRFRRYLTSFALYTKQGRKASLNFQLQNGQVTLKE